MGGAEGAFGVGDFAKGAAEVDGAGFGTFGIFPGDRSPEGPIDFEDGCAILVIFERADVMLR